MIYLRYLWSVLRHKWFILRAGRLVGLPLWRLILHDWSKFLPVEFSRYARWHFSGHKDRREWATAWHHHLRLNAHHHEHYLLGWYGEDADFYVGIGEKVADFVVVLPMPEVYVREMIADMLAAGRTYTGQWDIATWVNRNAFKMHLHSKTLAHFDAALRELGYTLVDGRDRSWCKTGT